MDNDAEILIKDLMAYSIQVDSSQLVDKLFPNIGPQETDLVLRDTDYLDACNALNAYPPTINEPEDGYCHAIAGLFNAVLKFLPATISPRVAWVDTHNSHLCSGNDARGGHEDFPDLLLASLENEAVLLSIEGNTVAQRIKERHRKRKRIEALGDVNLARIVLSQTHVALVVKRDTSQRDSALSQLTGCISNMFKEQFDRRFIVSLAMCYDELTVVYCDRAGILVSTPIKVLKDSRDFARVVYCLARCVVSEPVKLGWDPYMKIFRPKNPLIPLPSYMCPFDEDRKTPPNNTNWIIEMPAEHAGGNDYREKFLTLNVIHVAHSEIMCGRATIVWEAVKLKDLPNPTTIYVIKQCWHNGRMPEGRLFIDGHLADAVFSFEDVRIGDEVDSTGSIRKRLKLHEPGIGDKHRQLVDRKLHRFAERFWGYPIASFRNLDELLNTTLSVIKNHRSLYLNGVLHGDICPDSIIICPTVNGKGGPDFVNTTGRVIDLNHAQKVEQFCSDPLPEFNDPCSDEIANYVHYMATEYLGDITFSLELAKKGSLSPASAQAVLYIVEAVLAHQRYKQDTSGECGRDDKSQSDLSFSPEELGWVVPKRLPAFGSVAIPYLQNGTNPYMSSEVYRGAARYCKVLPMNTSFVFCHEAIHDMESLFWVILQISIFLLPGNQPIKKEDSLPSIVLKLFSKDKAEVSRSKEDFFRDRTNAEKVFDVIHSYYRPLIPMLWLWRDILYLGFFFRSYEYINIHSMLEKLVDVTIHRLPCESQPLEAEVKEIRRREEHYNYLISMFKDVQMSSDISPVDVRPKKQQRREYSYGAPRRVEYSYGSPRRLEYSHNSHQLVAV